MSTNLSSTKLGFGTTPVFLATISTILGAILFLRFGYAVGHTGFWGTIGIIVIGHIVTIATAMAVSEIATNQRVEGGGAYFIISRSFGLNIGAAIGIALFLAQAVSVAFYIIAFAEAFDPVLAWLDTLGIGIPDKRFISLPAMALLTLLILTKGADLGVKALYVVCAVLFVSILLFFMGRTDFVPEGNYLMQTIQDPPPDDFFYVFAIIFPAFTGIAAGLGLSGDLRDPKKSIPWGTLSATFVGMIVYVFVAFKLASSASPEDLANDQFIMSRIAIWGPAIPIGLAAATVSSALGSVMIAPRTLQALGADKVFPFQVLNEWTSKERNVEPFNASLITCAIAFFFVLIGDVNFVAEIISMFFMVTYGAICLVSFLEHFAADPAYRPTFKSKWYISLIGAVACFWLMFQMKFSYAFASLAIMIGFYVSITYFSDEKRELSKIFQGVIFQVSRQLQIFLQKEETGEEERHWRPAVVCISKNLFKRLAAFDMLRWISHKYGFGTYIHQIDGYLSKETSTEARKVLDKLIKITEKTKSKVYFDTIVSPSSTTAIAQVVQLPGISGKDNNTLLFEYFRSEPDDIVDELVSNFSLIKAMDFDVYVLGSSERGYGFRKNIHIWITSRDYENANLMILVGFIILGHPDWNKGQIKLWTIASKDKQDEMQQDLSERIKEGRLPISLNNIEIITRVDERPTRDLINEYSSDADLTIIGFRVEALKKQGSSIFEGYDQIGNILFVNTQHEKEIV